jgi:hypothetical protein
MTFRVGQRVVCVKRDAWTDALSQLPLEADNFPVFGMVYTVRTIDAAHGNLYLRFEEIVNAPRNYVNGLDECNFWAARFRPVKETDISIFTAMLAPTPKQKQRVTTER